MRWYCTMVSIYEIGWWVFMCLSERKQYKEMAESGKVISFYSSNSWLNGSLHVSRSLIKWTQIACSQFNICSAVLMTGYNERAWGNSQQSRALSVCKRSTNNNLLTSPHLCGFPLLCRFCLIPIKVTVIKWFRNIKESVGTRYSREDVKKK